MLKLQCTKCTKYKKVQCTKNDDVNRCGVVVAYQYICIDKNTHRFEGIAHDKSADDRAGANDG